MASGIEARLRLCPFSYGLPIKDCSAHACLGFHSFSLVCPCIRIFGIVPRQELRWGSDSKILQFCVRNSFHTGIAPPMVR